MADFEKNELLVTIAKMYYEYQVGQQEIAEKLDISRSYVSRLLKESVDSGIVTITVRDILNSESALEKQMESTFGLAKAICVPVTEGNSQMATMLVAKMAARYFDSIIRDDDVVGVSWGSTLNAFSKHVSKRNDLKNIKIVQLCGGVSNLDRNIYAEEIVKNISNALNAASYALPLPSVVDSVLTKEAIESDRNIKSNFDLMANTTVAIFTIGRFGTDCALVRAEYLGYNDVRKLDALGAVGDICAHIIDINGRVCDEDLDSRTIGVSFSQLKNARCSIGLAVGEEKAKCIYGALNGKLINVLVVDEDTAKLVLRLHDIKTNGD